MIRFDERTGALSILDLGSIAAKYYIRHATVEVINGLFKPRMSEADVLSMLSKSTEVSSASQVHGMRPTIIQFNQVQVRENELPELTALQELCQCDVQVNRFICAAMWN